MTRLHHANIRVADATASLAFYRAIGLEHVGTLAISPGYTLLFLGSSGDGHAALELVVNDTADPDYDRSPGSGHVGIEVDDLDAALARLADLGVQPESAPVHPAGRIDLGLIAFVPDPDGNRIELMQHPWPLPADDVPSELAEAVK